MIYVLGSLRNPKVPEFAEMLRAAGLDVFDDWHGCGPEADDYWRSYEKGRGRSMYEALDGKLARHAFDFDKAHIDEADTGVLVVPAGKSAHMELGFMIGAGKRAYVLFTEEPDRWDMMYRFAMFRGPYYGGVYVGMDALARELQTRSLMSKGQNPDV